MLLHQLFDVKYIQIQEHICQTTIKFHVPELCLPLFYRIRERRQNILGPVSRHCLLRGGGGISKSAKVDAGGPKISQLINFTV